MKPKSKPTQQSNAKDRNALQLRKKLANSPKEMAHVNPRKFKEKIELQKKKQDDDQREFEKIMREVKSVIGEEPSKPHVQQITETLNPPAAPNYRGGSLPDVYVLSQNQPEVQASSNAVGMHGGGSFYPRNYQRGPGQFSPRGRSPGAGSQSHYHPYHPRSAGHGYGSLSPARIPYQNQVINQGADLQFDASIYGDCLYPPSDQSSWRRAISDPCVHNSLLDQQQLSRANTSAVNGGMSPQQQQSPTQQQSPSYSPIGSSNMVGYAVSSNSPRDSSAEERRHSGEGVPYANISTFQSSQAVPIPQSTGTHPELRETVSFPANMGLPSEKGQVFVQKVFSSNARERTSSGSSVNNSFPVQNAAALRKFHQDNAMPYQQQQNTYVEVINSNNAMHQQQYQQYYQGTNDQMPQVIESEFRNIQINAGPSEIFAPTGYTSVDYYVGQQVQLQQQQPLPVYSQSGDIVIDQQHYNTSVANASTYSPYSVMQCWPCQSNADHENAQRISSNESTSGIPNIVISSDDVAMSRPDLLQDMTGQASKMFLFSSDAVDPPAMIFMGKDKYENEDMIRWGWPEDVWFHVSEVSSAHVYLRLKPGETLDDIPEQLIVDCAQLVKANSIQGNKMANIKIVYTMWENLKKTNGMDVGQVGFHNPKACRYVSVEKRIPEIVKRLEKTQEEKSVNFQAEREARDRKESENKKRLLKDQQEREKELRKEREDQARLRSYADVFEKAGNVTTNKDGVDLEDDFM